MDKLTEIGIKYGTDKATYHGFTQFYFPYLIKYTNPSLFEVGIYHGGSLKMWEEFYGSPKIVAMDILNKTEYDSINVKTFVGNQSKPEDLLNALKFCNEFDIIVDDGSHAVAHQLITLATMFPHLKSGGTYILEDLHTSFDKSYMLPDDRITAYEFILGLKNGTDIHNRYFTPSQLEYIKTNVGTVEVYQRDPTIFHDSVTSVIVKK